MPITFTIDELLDELAMPHIPGYKVRRLLLQRGAETKQKQILELLESKLITLPKNVSQVEHNDGIRLAISIIEQESN